jgi:hypothetical protein
MDYYGSGELEIILWKPEVRVLGLAMLNCLCTIIISQNMITENGITTFIRKLAQVL